jgi:Trk-type K+ transport system membrane component
MARLLEGHAMEQAVLHLAHIAAWVFFIIFILALIGLIAIIRWVMNLFRRTEAAVESGVEKVEGAFRR